MAPSTDEVGEQPAERRGELEAVRGPEPHDDPLVSRHGGEHEVAVGGQRVLAAQRPHRAVRSRAATAAMKSASAVLHGRVGLRRTPVGVDHRAAAVLGRLHGRLAVAGEPVVATGRPSRSTAGCHSNARGLPRVRSRSPARASPRPARARRARPSTSLTHASAHTTRPRAHGTPVGGRHLDPVAEVAYAGHRTVLAQLGAVAPGLLLHHPGAQRGGHDRRVGLVQRERALGQPELRPARGDRRPRRAARSRRRPRPATACSRSARSPPPGGKRSRPPTLVTSDVPLASSRRAQSSYACCGQPDVRRRVVAVPQDPAGVVARPTRVAQLEALQPDDPVTAPGQLPARRAAQRAETGDHVVVVGVHCSAPSRGSSQRRMSRLSSSIGANQPCR